MNMKMKLAASLLILIVTLSGCAKDEVETTGTIYGIVNDGDNGEPIQNAQVLLNPSGITAHTGSDGRYEFLDLEPGQYTIQISKSGYKTNTKRISVIASAQASGDMVLAQGKSRIKLNVQSLNFTGQSVSKTFTITNIGTSGTAFWSVSNAESWLSVSPSSGGAAPDGSSTVVVNIDRSQLTKDVRSILIVESDGESFPIEVFVGVSGGGSGEDGGDGGGGSCGAITSCDSKVNVSFLQCVKNGSAVEFEFMITNGGDDLQLWFSVDSSDSVDDKGNTYKGNYTSIYIGDKKMMNGSSFNFIKNTPTKCKVTVPNVKATAAFLKRFDVQISSTQPWATQFKKITLEDIKW